MTDIKLECLLLSSGSSWYAIVMLILSYWYFVFMTNYLSHYQTGKMHHIDLIKYAYNIK